MWVHSTGESVVPSEYSTGITVGMNKPNSLQYGVSIHRYIRA